ncbi:MAG: bifunctional riboflavin kinase/FAD synthetase [Terrimesophilobacter sp.]
MDTYTSLNDVPHDFGPSAVTIGKFDGVHTGHKRVLDRLISEARADSLTATVLTFDRNPLTVLAPQVCPPELVSNAQRLALLERSGVDATVMLEFTRAFSENSPRDFVEGMLVNTLHAKLVLVGADFKFGRRGAGNVAMLKDMGVEHGYRVELLGDCELKDSRSNESRRVSSTWVRELLAEGDVASASRLLGREPVVSATVVRGAQRGRELGFPTANLAPNAEGLIPADGVYAAWVVVGGERYRAAVSIGNNPTFDCVAAKQVEAHLLGVGNDAIDIDLYGKTIEVHFVERLRGMVKFDSLAALISEMSDDVARVRALLPDEVFHTE